MSSGIGEMADKEQIRQLRAENKTLEKQLQPCDTESPSPHKCIVCPVEVRGIYAVAFNLINLFDGEDEERLSRKLPERIQELRNAVTVLQPFIDAHFEGLKEKKVDGTKKQD